MTIQVEGYFLQHQNIFGTSAFPVSEVFSKARSKVIVKIRGVPGPKPDGWTDGGGLESVIFFPWSSTVCDWKILVVAVPASCNGIGSTRKDVSGSG
jgi:hypothetical protein